MAILHAHATPHNVAFLASHVPVPDTFPHGDAPAAIKQSLHIISPSAYLASKKISCAVENQQEDEIRLAGNINHL